MCYAMLKGENSPCKDCMKMSNADENKHNYYEYDEKTGSWQYLTWKKITWCMREAIVVYIQDTTREKEHEISLDRMNQMYQMAIVRHYEIGSNQNAQNKNGLISAHEKPPAKEYIIQ